MNALLKEVGKKAQKPNESFPSVFTMESIGHVHILK